MKYSRMIGLALAAAFLRRAGEFPGTHGDIEEHQGDRRDHARAIATRRFPFSYLDDNQKPIGFAMDICLQDRRPP